MNKKQYLERRAQLMNEAQQLINAGKAQEAEEKMKEVSALDKQWDDIAQAEANFKALNKEPESHFMMNDTLNEKGNAEKNVVAEKWESDEYKNAWAKTLMGKQLTNDEANTFAMVNEAFTHTTENTSIVIPKTVTQGIWEMVGEIYPYFEDITKTYVNGVLTMIQDRKSVV